MKTETEFSEKSHFIKHPPSYFLEDNLKNKKLFAKNILVNHILVGIQFRASNS